MAVPEGWRELRLGEAADFVNGRAFKPEDWTDRGLPIVRIQNLNGGGVFNYFNGHVEPRYLVATGDLLFSWSGTRGTSFGPHYWRGPGAVLNQHIFNVRDLRHVERDYLFHALGYITMAIEQRAHGGTGIVHITKGELERFTIPCPPLPEQRKIAAILSSVDETIEKTEAVIEQLQVVKKAMMEELLTRGMPGRHTRFKQTEIGEVPEGWDVVGIFHVSAIDSRLVDPEDPEHRDLPLVAPNHVATATGRLILVESAAQQGARSGKYPFEAGDVVYSKIRPYLRKAWLADRAGLCSADMYPFRPSSRVVGRFLLAVLLSEYFTNYVASQSGRTGIPKVNREELEAFRFALPPRGEQEAIADVVGSVDARLESETRELERARGLKAALAAALLSGDLRVTPDEAQP